MALPAVASAAAPTPPPPTGTTGSGATIGNCLAQGSNLTAPDATTTCSDTNTDNGNTNINTIIKTVINIFSWIVGIVAVIMIIVGGFRYVTAGGDSNNVSSAKNTIIYAIIGLIIVAMAQFIVQFVLNKVNTAGA
jgi:hypothetical protein